MEKYLKRILAWNHSAFYVNFAKMLPVPRKGTLQKRPIENTFRWDGYRGTSRTKNDLRWMEMLP